MQEHDGIERAEASRLEALMAYTTECALHLRTDGTVQLGIEGLRRLLGPGVVPHFCDVLQRVHPDDAVAVSDAIAEASASPGRPVRLRVRVAGDDRAYRFLRMTFVDRSDDPSLDGWIVNLCDQTTDHFESANEVRPTAPVDLFQRFSTDAMIVMDRETNITYTSRSIERLLGTTADEMLGATGLDWVHPDDVELAVTGLAQILEAPGNVVTERLRLVTARGARMFEIEGRNHTHDPAINGVVLVYRDVEAETEALRALQESEERFRTLVESSPLGVFVLDNDGALLWANERWAEITGAAHGHYSGFAYLDSVHRSDQADVLQAWIDRPEPHAAVEATYRWIRPDGECRWIQSLTAPHLGPDGEVVGHVGTIHDITEEIEASQRFEAELERQACTDPLTGLPNRTLLRRFLDDALAQQASPGSRVAVLFCDLDSFKVINDSLGHHQGDLVLQAIATRLEAVVRPGDLVARFGGDEFVVVCPGADGAEVVDEIGRRLADAIAEPVVTDDRVLRVRASVGVAISYPGASADDILRDADVAMYRAKIHARGGIEVFDDELRHEVVRRHNIEQALRSAISTDRLHLYYQPIVDVADGSIQRIEALCRWTDPELGEISPTTFIPIAEETGLIADLGAWALRTACADLAALKALGATFGVAVNVSLLQVARPDFVADVLQSVRDAGLTPADLELEITESVLLEQGPDALDKLGLLRSRGVRLAIDDFGTGYSALSYLHRFDFDTLKVDRQFLSRVGGPDQVSRDIVFEAVVGMAQKLQMTTVAEGVEDEAGRAAVTRLGFDLAQGDLCGRPVSVGELMRQLETKRLCTPA